MSVSKFEITMLICKLFKNIYHKFRACKLKWKHFWWDRLLVSGLFLEIFHIKSKFPFTRTTSGSGLRCILVMVYKCECIHSPSSHIWPPKPLPVHDMRISVKFVFEYQEQICIVPNKLDFSLSIQLYKDIFPLITSYFSIIIISPNLKLKNLASLFGMEIYIIVCFDQTKVFEIQVFRT